MGIVNIDKPPIRNEWAASRAENSAQRAVHSRDDGTQ